MSHAYKEKWKATNDGKDRTTKSRKKNRTPGEMETYKYLGILETDPIKQAEMNEQTKKE